MKLAISVTWSGRFGLTNAYTSVPSATGSLLISGASRCDDMSATSCCVENPGGEVLVVDDDLPLADQQVDAVAEVVLDVGHDGLASAGGGAVGGAGCRRCRRSGQADSAGRPDPCRSEELP